MVLLFSLLSLALLIFDQALKFFVRTHIAIGSIHPLIPGVVSLTNVTNTGGAWSIFSGKMIFFHVITIIAVFVIGYMIKVSKKSDKFYRLGLFLLLSGTIGNAIDRFTNQYVTDMFNLEFMNFAIFNLADIYITIGVILIVIFLLFLDKDSNIHE